MSKRVRDPLEWRNDRRARFDVWLMFDRNVERAEVAVAVYEAQQARRDGAADGRAGPRRRPTRRTD